ncbi:apolipoprotein N-acyltransferase [Roseovarius confluentis]|uniref:apolipoprotein N-acyltransferase n=1 Tax=Roseovarius confluentis TaxID=1852027 RepID=UPI000CDE3AB7|nr:apolipoprotein N-acyltransferase [Roseovarius confluentis]
MVRLDALTRQIGEGRVWTRYAFAAGLGAAAALGQAPWGLWPLTIIALAVIFGLWRETRGWLSATILGLVAGTGHFVIALSWIFEPFLVDAARHGWMAPFAVLGLSVFMASYWAAAFAAARSIAPRSGVALVGAFVIGEVLRGWFFTGFAWAQVGHVLIDTPLLYWASVGGALGLCALVMGAAVALWHLGAGRRMAGAAGLAGIALLYGAGAAMTPTDAAAPGPEAQTVRLVQPNAAQHEKWRPENLQMFYDRQRQFTAAPGEDGRPDLVVWPETAIPTFLHESDDLLGGIAASAQGAPVVLGLRRLDGQRFYNSLLRLDETGTVSQVYDKHHLVPFGEFMPLGDLMARFGIHGLAAEEGGGYSAGPGVELVDMGRLGTAVPLICYEGVFARNILSAPERPDMILMITNDAWFGKISGPYQHLAQGRLRSAEQGLPMVRVANTGVSAMVDGTGRILAHIPLGEAGWIDTPLPPPLPPTLYSRTGEAPVLVLAVLLMLAGGVLSRRQREART